MLLITKTDWGVSRMKLIFHDLKQKSSVVSKFLYHALRNNKKKIVYRYK